MMPPSTPTPHPNDHAAERRRELFAEMYELIAAAAALKALLEELRLQLASPDQRPSRRLLTAVRDNLATLQRLRGVEVALDEIYPPSGEA